MQSMDAWAIPRACPAMPILPASKVDWGWKREVKEMVY